MHMDNSTVLEGIPNIPSMQFQLGSIYHNRKKNPSFPAYISLIMLSWLNQD